MVSDFHVYHEDCVQDDLGQKKTHLKDTSAASFRKEPSNATC